MALTLSQKGIQIQSEMLDRLRGSINGVVAAAEQMQRVQNRKNDPFQSRLIC